MFRVDEIDNDDNIDSQLVNFTICRHQPNLFDRWIEYRED